MNNRVQEDVPIVDQTAWTLTSIMMGTFGKNAAQMEFGAQTRAAAHIIQTFIVALLRVNPQRGTGPHFHGLLALSFVLAVVAFLAQTAMNGTRLMKGTQLKFAIWMGLGLLILAAVNMEERLQLVRLRVIQSRWVTNREYIQDLQRAVLVDVDILAQVVAKYIQTTVGVSTGFVIVIIIGQPTHLDARTLAEFVKHPTVSCPRWVVLKSVFGHLNCRLDVRTFRIAMIFILTMTDLVERDVLILDG